jgi:hypothetical protein
MRPHWIEFLPEARALLSILILTARTILAVRTLRSRSVRTSHAPADGAASSPAATTSTADRAPDQPARSAHPDWLSHTSDVALQVAQVCAAGLAVLDRLINSSFL